MLGAGALCVLASGLALSAGAPQSQAEDAADIPAWAFAAAAVLVLAPAVAILPKFSGAAVQLADPIFDHSKIAIVDAMARLGLPPINPVFGELGAPGHVAYYYLSAFQRRRAGAGARRQRLGSRYRTDVVYRLRVAEPDDGSCRLAQQPRRRGDLGRRPRRRRVAVGDARLDRRRPRSDAVAVAAGRNGRLVVQATWVPQHLMAASCAVTAMLLVSRFAQRQSLALLLVLVLVVVAGFESSSFVGGVTFAIAALVATPILFAGTEPTQRRRFAIGSAVAAALAVCLAMPFVLNQLAALRLRGGGSATLSTLTACSVRPSPTRSAACSISRPIGSSCCRSNCRPPLSPARSRSPWRYAALCRTRKGSPWPALACLTGTGLLVSSAFGQHAWRKQRSRAPRHHPRRNGIDRCRGGGIFSCALPRRDRRDGAGRAPAQPAGHRCHDRSNIAGEPRPGGQILAQTPELWNAVRRYAPPDARVANNPQFLRDVTPWPVNISWALLANRSSCFAGREMALAFAPLPPPRREAIDAQFIRVFAGEGTAADVNDMAKQYGCEVVVVVPQDKAWTHDPFAASPDYRSAENRDGRWRIYVRAK